MISKKKYTAFQTLDVPYADGCTGWINEVMIAEIADNIYNDTVAKW